MSGHCTHSNNNKCRRTIVAKKRTKQQQIKLYTNNQMHINTIHAYTIHLCAQIYKVISFNVEYCIRFDQLVTMVEHSIRLDSINSVDTIGSLTLILVKSIIWLLVGLTHQRHQPFRITTKPLKSMKKRCDWAHSHSSRSPNCPSKYHSQFKLEFIHQSKIFLPSFDIP